MCETNLSTFAISFGFHIYLKVDKKPSLAGDMAKKQGGAICPPPSKGGLKYFRLQRLKLALWIGWSQGSGQYKVNVKVRDFTEN